MMNTENTVAVVELPAQVLKDYAPHVDVLEAWKATHQNVVHDVTTVQGYEDALRDKKESKALFNTVDKVRKIIKADALKRCQDIDTQFKMFVAPVTDHMAIVEAQLAIQDEKTAIRIAAIESKIESIKTLPMRLLGKTAEHIRECLHELMGTNPNDFEEYNHAAKGAIDAAIPQIEAILEDRERLEIAEAKQRELAEESRQANEAIAVKQREQQAVIDAQQKEIDDARKEIQAENNRIAQEKQDRENNERIALERAEAAKAALIKADQDRVDREIRDAEEKAKAKALQPDIEKVISWVNDSIIATAPTVNDPVLAAWVSKIISGTAKHRDELKAQVAV
jgi:hypothetical protein